MKKDSYQFYVDLVENSNEIIFIVEESGEISFFNKAFLEETGYTRAVVKKLNFFNLIDLKHQENAIIDIKGVKKTKPLIEYSFPFKNANNKRIYILGDVSTSTSDDNTKRYWFSMRNITKRRSAEKAQKLYYSIAQSNLNTQDLSEFLKEVQLALQENIYANNFFVAVYEPEKGEIHFPYHVDEKYKIDERRKIGNGIVEYSIVQNKPLILYKKDVEQLIEKEKIFMYSPVLPAIQVMVPLELNKKTIGVIGIKSYSDQNKFADQDLELLHFISGQVALAMVRKQSEANLRLQTARLNAIFDSSSHQIWTVDKHRVLKSFNKNYARVISKTLGAKLEINTKIEKFGWRLIHESDMPKLREHYNKAFEGKTQFFEMHWGEINGGDQWYEFYLNPILSAETGQIEEVSGIARNITESKNAIIKIQKSEEKFRNIIESFIDIYYRTDLAGNITMISPSVEKHTGYSLEEIKKEKVNSFFSKAVDVSTSIKTLLKSGNVTNLEVDIKRKDGVIRPFILNIRLIKNSKGIPIEVEGVARDISELKKSSEELIKAKEHAEESLKAKEMFLANMSHEIRTPMNGIIGMIDVLNETKLNKEQQDYVRTVKNSSETLLTILNDILDISKIEAGKMELINAPLDLTELLNRLVALFSQKATEKNNTLKFNLEEGVPKYILGDQTRLLQILSNLTSNALKFTKDGEVNIITSIHKEHKTKPTLKIEVKDTGIGISKENQKLLFNAFQQVDLSTKKQFGGTGLGLVISKELSRRMRGNMGMHSEPEKGSNFWFTFEAETCEATKTIKEEITIKDFFKNKAPKILLVDDNAINRKVASEILKKAGCTVLMASSGRSAIDTVSKTNDLDLILMDIQMPEMDGIETTQILKKDYSKSLPKIVAMTAYSMENDKQSFIEKGLDEYISKPIRAAVLLNKINEILGQSQIETKVEKEPEILDYDFEVINSLRDMVGQEMLLSVFADFEREAEEQIKATLAAFKKKDIVTIQKELHTLKGNSGTLGLMNIYEITKEIEEPSKKGKLTNFSKNFKKLEAAFTLFKNDYKGFK